MKLKAIIFDVDGTMADTEQFGHLAACNETFADSKTGFQAAKTAEIPCAVIYNDYTFGDNFAGAQLVARSLEHFTLEQLAALCLPEFGS